MDDELDSLEAELKQLRPIAPSAVLQQSVAAALARPAAARPGWWLGLVALPIAAAIALAVATSGPRPTQAKREGVPATASALKPVSAENILYAAQDEGVVTLGDGTTARRARLRYVDTITWQNPKTHASLTWTIPREEVRFVPVRYQ